MKYYFSAHADACYRQVDTNEMNNGKNRSLPRIICRRFKNLSALFFHEIIFALRKPLSAKKLKIRDGPNLNMIMTQLIHWM